MKIQFELLFLRLVNTNIFNICKNIIEGIKLTHFKMYITPIYELL